MGEYFMRSIVRFVAHAALILALVSLAACNRGPGGGSGGAEVQIKDVQIGLKPGPIPTSEDSLRRSPLFKAGHWTPILVEIEGKGKLENAELVVEVIDSDDVLNNYRRRLEVVDFSAENPTYTFVTYARPGKIDSPINVYLRSKQGQNLCQPNEKTPYGQEASSFLYVTLGARLPGLRLPGSDDKDKSRSEVAAIDNVAELPTRWYGYNTADLVVLTTGRKDFISGLLDDEAKRTALFEWVRRGGKLVMSVGENQQELTRPTLEAFLPVEFTGLATPASLPISWDQLPGMEEALSRKSERTTLTVAKMKAKQGRSVRTPVNWTREGTPLVAQAPYGLGRITLVGFDLDKGPFTEWKGQKPFWEKLLKEAGPTYATQAIDQDNVFTGSASRRAEDEDVQTQLQSGVESFDGVPIISFGWVALFILLYILVVGPLDYFFLKKVVKRLELTWVTFPLVVVLVSAAAYFTAYAIKGDDQKLNKLDLIDIDLQTRTAQGTTWFSIFSPQVQNYTVGVEPMDGWGVKSGAAVQPHVSWLGAVRKGRQSLFRRSYDYTDDATGLQRVPIPVWATKGFQATWQSPLEDGAEPVESQLIWKDTLAGGITSNLPVPLEDVVLFHRGKAYTLDTLMPKQKKVVTVLPKLADAWFQSQPMPYTKYGSKSGSAPIDPEPSRTMMPAVLFNEARERSSGKSLARNGGFRELDQSWRLKPDDPGEEAILFGRVRAVSGQAADVAQKPGAVTQLWLGALPGSGSPTPPKINGTMRQETYVRIYLPVTKSK